MPVITAIKRQKQRTDRYSVFVDDSYSFSLSDLDISLSRLAVGQELEESEVKAYELQSTAGKAYEVALRYLSYRHRSEREVYDQLQCKGYEVEAGPVLERLKIEGLLGDAEFAGHWIADRQALKPRSRRMLAAELRAKGLHSEVIGEAMVVVSPAAELEAARAIAAKKRLQPTYQNPLKLQRYLASQGFTWETIRQAMDFGSEL